MKRMFSFLLTAAFFTCLHTATSQTPPAFPGALGFGAKATGGRGGNVVYVTTLAPDGPGSLNEALSTPGKRYILFRVSGVIDAAADIIEGDVTIAGQTSPGGVIVRGILADDVYDNRGNADNIIIRHLRSRPRLLDEPAGGSTIDDALRLDGASRLIADHCSFANAADETVQISQSRDITIQNCILAEPLGEHFYLGGMLINYSTQESPQDSISVVRSVWNRVGGRMPELSCESAFCSQQPLHMELSNNLLWDIPIQVWYNSGIDPSAEPPKDSFFVQLNLVGNHAVARPGYGGGMFGHNLLEFTGNTIYAHGNTLNLYPDYSDYELFYCCNDFASDGNHPNTDLGIAAQRVQRHHFADVDYLNSAEEVPEVLGAQAGAFPRDSMDRRLMNAIISRTIDPTPVDAEAHYFDHFHLDFEAGNPPAAPADSDNDGMPDYWETANGLNPFMEDHNGTTLSMLYTQMEGYTNLECYLNKLADSLVQGTPTVVTGVDGGRDTEIRLHCYPNPISHATSVNLFLPRPGRITLAISNAPGAVVQTTTTDILPAGMHSIPFIPASRLSNGVYLCRVSTAGTDLGTLLFTLVR